MRSHLKNILTASEYLSVFGVFDVAMAVVTAVVSRITVSVAAAFRVFSAAFGTVESFGFERSFDFNTVTVFHSV